MSDNESKSIGSIHNKCTSETEKSNLKNPTMTDSDITSVRIKTENFTGPTNSPEIAEPPTPMAVTPYTELYENSRKRHHDEMTEELNGVNLESTQLKTNTDLPGIQTKLSLFQATLLDDNVDQQALSSALSLLNSRLNRVKDDINDLKDLKSKVKKGTNVKEICQELKSKKSYIKEISYKGVVVKCPTINWKRDYEIDIDRLKNPDVLLSYKETDSISDGYEIIRRESIFK